MPSIPTGEGYNTSYDRIHPSSSLVYSTGSTRGWSNSVSRTWVSRTGEGNNEITSDAKFYEKNWAKYLTAAKGVTPKRWIPGVKSNLPWTLISAFFGTIAWVGACIGVILAAHGTQTTSWAISPTVILAILGPLGSIMLQYALSCGMAITWWNLALSGTTLGALRRQWEFGTSMECRGIWTTIDCDLRHATVSYSFVQRDGVIPSETLKVPVRILQTEDELPSGMTIDVIFQGLDMVTSSTLVSFTVLHSSYRHGWEFRFDGLLAGKYLRRDGDNGNCSATPRDPTEEVLSMLHEAMFRIAVAAPNATSPRAELIGQQEIMVRVYLISFVSTCSMRIWGCTREYRSGSS